MNIFIFIEGIMVYHLSYKSWHNGHCHGKWIQGSKFKSWTMLFAFHIVLISLGKVCIKLFSIQRQVNSRVDWAL